MTFITEIHDHIRNSRRFIDLSGKSFPQLSKKYPRLPQIALSAPAPIPTTLTDALSRRISAKTYAETPIALDTLAQIFGHGLRVRKDGHRPYPSGGGLYPIETYFISFAVESLQRAAYHYRPDTHTLEYLWDIDRDDAPATFVNAECENAAGLFVFTALWERSAQKYRDFTYNLAHMEAGHMCQNLALLSAALGVSMRSLAGFKDTVVTATLDIDKNQEQPVYAALIGNIASDPAEAPKS